jgi:polyferredoxin
MNSFRKWLKTVILPIIPYICIFSVCSLMPYLLVPSNVTLLLGEPLNLIFTFHIFVQFLLAYAAIATRSWGKRDE